MNIEDLKQLLTKIQEGSLGVDDAMQKMKYLPFHDLGHTKLDNHRELRQGYPEVVFCEGKTAEQVTHIVSRMVERGQNVWAPGPAGKKRNQSLRIFRMPNTTNYRVP